MQLIGKERDERTSGRDGRGVGVFGSDKGNFSKIVCSLFLSYASFCTLQQQQQQQQNKIIKSRAKNPPTLIVTTSVPACLPACLPACMLAYAVFCA
jgi:hypothetical protein